MNNLHLLFSVFFFFFHLKKVVEKVLLDCSDGNVDGEVTGSELLLVVSCTVWCSRAGAQGNEPENMKQRDDDHICHRLVEKRPSVRRSRQWETSAPVLKVDVGFHKWLQVIQQVGWVGDEYIPSCHFCPALNNSVTCVTLTEGCSGRWKPTVLYISGSSFSIFPLHLPLLLGKLCILFFRLHSFIYSLAKISPFALVVTNGTSVFTSVCSICQAKTCESRTKAAISPLFSCCFDALDK